MTQPDSTSERVPEDVIVYSVDCEGSLDYAFALYLGRNDDCSVLIEEWLLRRFSFGEKLGLLKQMMKREKIDWAPYDTLGAELQKLFQFRDSVAHSSPDNGDPFRRLRRLRRRRAQNEVVEISPEELAEQLDRGMRCQSAVRALPNYLRRDLWEGNLATRAPSL